ncbi:MAG: DNA-binding protein [Prevotella sp.]|nr:DNA-binding protein [Prevotella sp.]
MALKINLYRNTNTASKGYGLVYGRVENDDVMSLEELAQHMHDHNSPYETGLIIGILINMVKCIRELALEGKPVKLDNLAIIKCQVETKGAASYLDFDLSKNVKNIRLSAVSTGNFTRAELNKAGKLGYTSLAESMRNAERPTPEPDGGSGDGNNG